jgi:class 3 adenylate cyclase
MCRNNVPESAESPLSEMLNTGEQEDMKNQLFHKLDCGDIVLSKGLIEKGAKLTTYIGRSCLHYEDEQNSIHTCSDVIESGMHVDVLLEKKPVQSTVDEIRRPVSDENAEAAVAPLRTIPNKCAGKEKKIMRRRASISEQRSANAEIVMKYHFPEAIATSMMSYQYVAPVCKQSVSICFSDVENYAHMRGSLDPPVLFDMLDRLFNKLDCLAALHGVQRIDAIDGCYIAATNYSNLQPDDHAVRLARFATDIMAAAAATAIDPAQPSLGAVRLLAGLHCGAVYGGLVGTHGGRKHTLLGDAVNVASRMQSHGAAGAVQCSGGFAALVRAQAGACGAGRGLRLLEREGGVELRGRGRMDAFWVTDGGLAAAAGQDEGGLVERSEAA